MLHAAASCSCAQPTCSDFWEFGRLSARAMHQAAHPSARAFKSRSARCSWRHAGHTIPDSEPTVAAQCLPLPRIPCCILMCSTTKVRFAADSSVRHSARARARGRVRARSACSGAQRRALVLGRGSGVVRSGELRGRAPRGVRRQKKSPASQREKPGVGPPSRSACPLVARDPRGALSRHRAWPRRCRWRDGLAIARTRARSHGCRAERLRAQAWWGAQTRRGPLLPSLRPHHNPARHRRRCCRSCFPPSAWLSCVQSSGREAPPRMGQRYAPALASRRCAWFTPPPPPNASMAAC